MCKFTLYSILIVVCLSYNSVYAQVKFNISGNSQIFYSSDWNERPNNDFSVKTSLEIPISKKHIDFAIVPHFRYQKDDLFYEYLTYNHNNTKFFIFNDAYYEHGQFKDVRFTMDKYLFGLTLQRRVVNQLYLGFGYGVAYNVYNDLQGHSTSLLHYYDVNLSAFKLPSNLNTYYSVNLQYKIPIIPKIDIILGGEFVKHQKIDIKDLNILGLKQHSFHLDIGLGYRF